MIESTEESIEKTVYCAEHGSMMITGEHIPLYRYIVMARVLKLEMLGFRSTKGRTCYSIIKSELGYRGNRKKVLAQLEAHIADTKAMLQDVEAGDWVPYQK